MNELIFKPQLIDIKLKLIEIELKIIEITNE